MQMTPIRGAHLVANKRIIEWAQASGLAGIHKVEERLWPVEASTKSF